MNRSLDPRSGAFPLKLRRQSDPSTKPGSRPGSTSRKRFQAKHAIWGCALAAAFLILWSLLVIEGPVDAGLVLRPESLEQTGQERVFLWKVKKTGSSTIASLLCLHGVRHGWKQAPCRTVTHVCGSMRYVYSLLGRAVNTGRYEVSLNHCVCPAAATVSGNAGLQYGLFGGDKFFQVITLRNPLERAVSAYYWFGSQQNKWRKVPGVQHLLNSTAALHPPDYSLAMKYAKTNFFRRAPRDWHPFRLWARFSRSPEQGIRHLRSHIFPIIFEKYDESLIILRERLRWPMHTILYGSARQNKPHSGAGAWPQAALIALNTTAAASGDWKFYKAALHQHEKYAKSYRFASHVPGGTVLNAPANIADAVARFREAKKELSGMCVDDPNLLARSKRMLESMDQVSCGKLECTYSAGSKYVFQILTHCVQELYKEHGRPSWVW